MSHEYTSVEHLSWREKKRIGLLFAGIGCLLIIWSIHLLRWNETRVNMATLAHKSVDVGTAAAKQGKLVSVTGSIMTDSFLGDDRFVRPGNYVVLDRIVEMYSWKERVESQQREKKVGGSETRTTTYSYTREWTTRPESSSGFKYAAAHHNPDKAIPDRMFKVNTARIGAYNLDMNSLSYVSNPRSNCNSQANGESWIGNEMYRSIRLRPTDTLTLTPANSQQQGNSIITPNYIFQGVGMPQSPQVGDIRVCYAVVPVGSIVTVFGRLDRSQITVYPYQDIQFFRSIPGDRSAALQTLCDEEKFWKWMLRFFGFFLMYIGIWTLGNLLAVWFDYFPWLGWSIERLVAKLTPVLALFGTIVTILLAWI